MKFAELRADGPPPPWEGFDAPGTSPCWVHYRSEPIGDDTYRICFECGHVWTRRSLVKAYRAISRTRRPRRLLSDKWWGDGLLRWAWRYLTVTAKKIHFCQECVHDW